MAIINFTDKVALNDNQNVQDINKVKDSDINLFKQVCNQIITTLGLYVDNWSSSSTYSGGDIVIDDNRLFINLTGTNTTAEPKNDSTNWQELYLINNGNINKNLIKSLINNSNSNADDETYSCDYENKYFGGVELYNDSTGSADEITLNDDIDNYSRIKIFYTASVDDSYEFIPQSTAVKIALGTKYKTGSLFIQTIGTYSCNGNKITPQLEECGYLSTSSSGSSMHWDNTNYCSIKKVIGYK